MENSNVETKVWGYHADSNTKIELLSGFSFISFDGTRYVVGGWERNKKTRRPELAVFEADGARVYLGKEERVNNGMVLELGEDPTITEQLEWDYVKAPMEVGDAYVKPTPEQYIEPSYGVSKAKRRLEKARKENAERKKKLAEELAKQVEMDSSDPVTKVESYDKRSTEEVKPEPSEEVIEEQVNKAMDAIVDMQDTIENTKQEVEETTQLMSAAVNQVTDLDENEDDDSIYMSDEDLDSWLSNMQTETQTRALEATKKATKSEMKEKKEKRKQKETKKKKKESEKDTLVDNSTTEKRAENVKAGISDDERFAKINERLAKMQKAMSDKSFQDSPTTTANMESPVDNREKPVQKGTTSKPNEMAVKGGQFGARINAIKELAEKEEKLIQKAEIVNTILDMDDETTNALLTIARAMMQKDGKCNVIVM